MTSFWVGLLLGSSLLQTLSTVRAQARSFGEQCLDDFKQGKEGFVLDTDESVKDGAQFITSPNLSRKKDCIVSCCKDPNCNLALMEDDEEGLIKGCFLFNCLYKQKYVCRFVKKSGFNNYIMNSVFEKYLEGPHISVDDDDKPPVANAGQDRVVQPQDVVPLDGIESKDDKKIERYEWRLVQGNSSAVLEKSSLPDQVMVSNLFAGVYKFQLTVFDSIGQSDTAEVTILVLTPEQSQDHCLAPKKVGPCRGSFQRWHYNAVTEQCEEFTFGGCKENLNNYLSLKECTKACDGVSVRIPDTHGSGRMLPPRPTGEECGQPCKPEQFTCANGCCIDKSLECDKTPQCSDSSDEESCEKLNERFRILLQIPVDEQKVRCTDPPKTGPCRASMTNWYYDPLERKCFRFNYGGCEGNENRFETSENCLRNCKMVTEKDVFARGAFEYQEASQSQSGTIAIAVLLGVAILITLAVLGYCFLKGRKEQQQHQTRRMAVNGSQVSTMEDTHRLVYNSTTKPI
ncbi:hypothetical protein AGOR_G00106320 [Albula goreensis]|uniref:Low-density lipoprotein receptor-related protein 11 n=1 Tax=Albula goreensis TaxID=1534307 RepID=A0A8T3DGG0_9TELE|nr:hypothetical protein AGOR_G00106320 [Albula goreensis]